VNDDAARLGSLISIISFDRQEVISALLTDDDLNTLKHLARKGTSENSLRALTSDLACLEAWCLAATGGPLPWPAPEALVLKFIAHHLYDPAEKIRDPSHGMPDDVEIRLKAAGLFRCEGPQAPSTVRRRMSSWATLHRLRGLDGPFADPPVREAIKRAAKASHRRPTRKSRRAIVRDVLEDLLATCDGIGPAALRDRALLLVAFASGGRRRSEIATLRVEQLIPEAPVPANPATPEGRMLSCMTIELGRTKTTAAEDASRVKLVGRAADALQRWLDRAAISAGYIFRRIDRWDNIDSRPLSPAGVNHIVKRRLALAGYDVADYSAHGLRAGYLTQAAKDGVALPEAMRQSQHRSVQQAANYYNDAEAELSRAARLAE
jgi:site-specific recombinase XerD